MKVRKHYIGIALIITGIVFFVAFTEKKSNNRIFSKKMTVNGQVFKDSIFLKPKTNYVFAFSAVHEAGGGFSEWPTVSANMKIFNKKRNVLFETSINVSEHREVGGLRRAQDYKEFKYLAPENEQVFIETQLLEGDKMEVEVYENLSDLGNILPGLGVIMALVGFVVFIKLRKNKSD